MSFLVTGATGTVGRVVVDQLIAKGVPVRAITRDPATAGLPSEAEVVAADLAEPGSVPVDGVTGLFLLSVITSPNLVDYARTLLGRARAAGVRRVVYLSSDAVHVRRPGSFEEHRAVEEVVEASGLEWTHLRPGEFAVNKLGYWGPSIRAEGVIRNAFPDTVGVPVHEADIAEVAVTALLTGEHAGRAYRLTGPAPLTHREQAAAVAEGVGRPLRFEAVGYGRARRDMIAVGFPADVAEYVLGYQAEYTDEPPTVSPDFERVTGRAGRTLAQWAADHRDDLL